MPIMLCPSCNGKVSTEAEKCPHCGDPLLNPPPSALEVSVVAKNKSNVPLKLSETFGAILAIVLLGGFIWAIVHYLARTW